VLFRTLAAAALIALTGTPTSAASDPAIRVKDINPGPLGFENPLDSLKPSTQMLDVGGKVFFPANDGSHGSELWVSDGTEEGTRLVKDLNLDGSSAPWYLPNWNGPLFFAVGFGPSPGLWKSDGTADGTTLVKLFGAFELPNVPPYDLTLASGKLYFFTSGASGQTLWRSDGTPGGTVPVTTIAQPASASPARNLMSAGGRLFFLAAGASDDYELWVSDGTADGTRILDINPGAYGSNPRELIDVDGTLFFWVSFGDTFALMKSDGTASGTVQLKNFGYDASRVGGSTAVGNRLFVVVDDLFNGPGLWVSDGTQDGTRRLVDIRDFNALSLASVGGKLLFADEDLAHGPELWVSDGTISGTRMLKDINLGPAGAEVDSIRQVRDDGWALFAATDGQSGVELWQTDGTPERTTRLQDIAPGAASSSPASFVTSGSRVLFVADDGSSGAELWALDQGIFPNLRPHKVYVPLMRRS